MYDHDNHDDDHDDANDYAYKFQFQLPQQVSTSKDCIHNNMVWYKVRTRENTHIELLVLLQQL